ncbi:hypothetical protein GCM10010187_48800 [Actinomadura coerulea]|nr:hypothetical protein GCM10010187_48800 [Actinomadura coerulea]
MGAGRPVAMTERAVRYLAKMREGATATGHLGGTVITRNGDDVRWWNWAGYRANAVLTVTSRRPGPRSTDPGDHPVDRLLARSRPGPRPD